MPLIPYSGSMGKILPHHKKMVSLALSLPKNVLKLRTEKDLLRVQSVPQGGS